MMRIQQSVVIDRPIDEVFTFVSDASNDRRWETGVEACVPDREPAVGQQRDVVMEVFGRRHQGTAEVTEYEVDQRLTIALKSGLPVTGTSSFAFQAVDESTRIDYTMEAEPVNPVFRLGQPVMAWMLKRQWANDLETLKALLESEEAPEGAAN